MSLIFQHMVLKNHVKILKNNSLRYRYQCNSTSIPPPPRLIYIFFYNLFFHLYYKKRLIPFFGKIFNKLLKIRVKSSTVFIPMSSVPYNQPPTYLLLCIACVHERATTVIVKRFGPHIARPEFDSPPLAISDGCRRSQIESAL